MKNIAVIGSGKIGYAIARFLADTDDYRVTVADNSAASLARYDAEQHIATQILDVTKSEQCQGFISGKDAVISACSFDLNRIIAESALATGVSYFDLTEDVKTTRYIFGLSKKCQVNQVFVPQCGLAPGFISILTHALCEKFEALDTVKMRVGALPMYPSNMMMYNLTWSTDGLINEYCNPCDAIVDGNLLKVLPLEGLETFSLDGKDYEAFNTSGGLGTLCETFQGKVNNLNYKTVRYKGHQYLMRFLVNELELKNRRVILKDVLETSVPITRQDVVLVFSAVSGTRKGRHEQMSDARKIYHQDVLGEHWSSIQLTTASAICAVVDLFFEGKLPNKGFVKQEQVSLVQFLENRFGHYFESKL